MQDFGVLYYVDSNPGYRKMMDISIESLKRFHPDWNIKIVEAKQYSTPLWKKIYRAVSFWKWQGRKNRFNMDPRIILDKAYVMLDTPFENTLYIDVDTIVMKDLNEFRDRIEDVDLIATAMPWKNYEGFQEWQPKTFPMVNSGVIFYNQTFVEEYRGYVDKIFPYAGKERGAYDQYIMSMACYMEKDNLNINLDPRLQIDAMNLAQHLGAEDFPQVEEGVIDLSCEELKDFHIFHYNGPYKRSYMPQIQKVFGLPGAA